MFKLKCFERKCSVFFSYITQLQLSQSPKSVVYTFKLSVVNPYKPSVLLHETYTNSADPDQTPQNVASDQGHHYLLTESSIKI